MALILHNYGAIDAKRFIFLLILRFLDIGNIDSAIDATTLAKAIAMISEADSRNVNFIPPYPSCLKRNASFMHKLRNAFFNYNLDYKT